MVSAVAPSGTWRKEIANRGPSGHYGTQISALRCAGILVGVTIVTANRSELVYLVIEGFSRAQTNRQRENPSNLSFRGAPGEGIS